MSMSLMVSAMACKVGNPLRKLVLIKLADNANDSGECWPSYQNIADQCEISKSSVKNHIRELEKAGFLTRVYRKQGNLNKSNIFHLTLGQHTPQGVSQEMPQVGQEMPEGGAGDARGGEAGDAPRTSHSSEPVKEPVKEPKRTPAKKSIPPSEDQVEDYATENGLNLTGFFDYYQSNGWRVGKNPMRDWEAAARNWHKRQSEFSPRQQKSQSRRPGEFPSDRIINGEVL